MKNFSAGSTEGARAAGAIAARALPGVCPGDGSAGGNNVDSTFAAAEAGSADGDAGAVGGGAGTGIGVAAPPLLGLLAGAGVGWRLASGPASERAEDPGAESAETRVVAIGGSRRFGRGGGREGGRATTGGTGLAGADFEVSLVPVSPTLPGPRDREREPSVVGGADWGATTRAGAEMTSVGAGGWGSETAPGTGAWAWALEDVQAAADASASPAGDAAIPDRGAGGEGSGAGTAMGGCWGGRVVSTSVPSGRETVGGSSLTAEETAAAAAGVNMGSFGAVVTRDRWCGEPVVPSGPR